MENLVNIRKHFGPLKSKFTTRFYVYQTQVTHQLGHPVDEFEQKIAESGDDRFAFSPNEMNALNMHK